MTRPSFFVIAVGEERSGMKGAGVFYGYAEGAAMEITSFFQRGGAMLAEGAAMRLNGVIDGRERRWENWLDDVRRAWIRLAPQIAESANAALLGNLIDAGPQDAGDEPLSAAGKGGAR